MTKRKTAGLLSQTAVAVSLSLVWGIIGNQAVGAFQVSGRARPQRACRSHPSSSVRSSASSLSPFRPTPPSCRVLRALNDDDDDDTAATIRATPFVSKDRSLDAASDVDDDDANAGGAATNTVNSRLMAELRAQESDVRVGPTSKFGRTLASLRPERTEAERAASLAEARDLNGVNPVIAVTASLVALAMGFGLWTLTTYLGTLFATHPVDLDAPYAFQRVAGVFRNAVMGLASLLSGFFGVTGLGVLLLGLRVGYGVATGELDPTPIKKPVRTTSSAGSSSSKDDGKPELDLSNAWDLMRGKKPGKRSRR